MKIGVGDVGIIAGWIMIMFLTVLVPTFLFGMTGFVLGVVVAVIVEMCLVLFVFGALYYALYEIMERW